MVEEWQCSPLEQILHFASTSSLLALDIVGFTALSSKLTPRQVVNVINVFFCAFDQFCSEVGVEKICTIGDAYIACGSLPTEVPDHAVRVCELASKIIRYVDRCNSLGFLRTMELTPAQFAADVHELQVLVRIGVHSGPMYGAVVGGFRNFHYDVLGDVADVAVRFEEEGVSGRAHLSHATQQLVDGAFATELRPDMMLHGMHCYLLGERLP